LPEDASDEERAVAFAKALARRAVLAWEGIGDADGKPIDPSPEAIDALLDVWPIFEAFQLTYVSKGLLLEQEKNASALSPNGPSAGATDTAKPAPAKRADCPARLNRPLTYEGWQVWDLVGRLGGQLRVLLPGAVIGWDMSAALTRSVTPSRRAAARLKRWPNCCRSSIDLAVMVPRRTGGPRKKRVSTNRWKPVRARITGRGRWQRCHTVKVISPRHPLRQAAEE
jgi:hypothetical protein